MAFDSGHSVMTPSENDKHLVQEFISAIAPLEQAYVHAAFHYVAVKTGDRFAILQGRVFLTTANPNLPTFLFGSPNVRAGRISLPELNLDIRSFVDRLMTGKLETRRVIFISKKRTAAAMLRPLFRSTQTD